MLPAGEPGGALLGEGGHAFLEIIGPEYIEMAFRWAHEADPGALLFYNDYRETDPVKRGKILRLVRELKQKGVPIHGVGMQCHWSIYGPKEEALEAALRDYASLGLPIHITELDVSIWPGEPERREKRPSESDDRMTPEKSRAQDEVYAMAFRLFTTPTLRKAIESPIFRDNPVLQLALEQAKHSIPMPVDNRIRFIWDGFRGPYRRVFTDNLPPDEAARLMQEEAERRIAEGQP